MMTIGLSLVGLGILGLVYCMIQAMRARADGLKGDLMAEKLRRLVPVNLASFCIATFGLMMVVFAVLI